MLVPLRFVLVPTGRVVDDGSGSAACVLYDMIHPAARQHTVDIAEAQAPAFADCDGLLVCTTFRVRDMVDTSRLRQALVVLATQQAAIGRVSDVPGRRILLETDLAPVVASMKRVVDEVNHNATPPAETSRKPGR